MSLGIYSEVDEQRSRVAFKRAGSVSIRQHYLGSLGGQRLEIQHHAAHGVSATGEDVLSLLCIR
jgi:hypothetical protein